MHNLKQLRDKAPNKTNGSPQFPDDGVGAHSVHTGRKGGNKIDVKQSTEIGQAMLDHLEAGDVEISSVNPKEYNNPVLLGKLIQDVNSGKIKQTRIETGEISEDNQPRKKKLSISMKGGPIPQLDIIYKLPDHAH